MNTSLILETEVASKIERTAVMDVQNITKSLPLGRERIDILKGISFQIMSGEFVSIVGPSGSGKSTLLGIIAGLDNPTSGQVYIDGVDITRMTEGKLAAVHNSKIGMVFQAFNVECAESDRTQRLGAKSERCRCLFPAAGDEFPERGYRR